MDGRYFAAIPMTKAGLEEIETDPAYQEFPLRYACSGAYQFQNWPQEMYRSPANATFFTALSDAFENVRWVRRRPRKPSQT